MSISYLLGHAPPALYGPPTMNGGYLSYPSTPIPSHHGPPPAPLALTWNGAASIANGGTINSQKLPPPPSRLDMPHSTAQNAKSHTLIFDYRFSIHGSNFGTVGPAGQSFIGGGGPNGTVISRSGTLSNGNALVPNGHMNGHGAPSYPGTFPHMAPPFGYPPAPTPYFVTFPAEDSDGEHLPPGARSESGRR